MSELNGFEMMTAKRRTASERTKRASARSTAKPRHPAPGKTVLADAVQAQPTVPQAQDAPEAVVGEMAFREAPQRPQVVQQPAVQPSAAVAPQETVTARQDVQPAPAAPTLEAKDDLVRSTMYLDPVMDDWLQSVVNVGRKGVTRSAVIRHALQLLSEQSSPEEVFALLSAKAAQTPSTGGRKRI